MTIKKPLCDKKKAYMRKSFDLFLLYLYNRFCFVLEVLYERNSSTKEGAQVSFIEESFLIRKPWNFQQIHVRPLELANYTIMLLPPL